MDEASRGCVIWRTRSGHLIYVSQKIEDVQVSRVSRLTVDEPGSPGFGEVPGAVIAWRCTAERGSWRGGGQLHRLTRCDLIQFHTADGATRTYTVTDTNTVPFQDLSNEDIWRTEGPAELVLVTCAGRSRGETGEGVFGFAYTHNLVVKVVPGLYAASALEAKGSHLPACRHRG